MAESRPNSTLCWLAWRALSEHGGHTAHVLVGQHVVERDRNRALRAPARQRHPPVRVLVDGARHVGLTAVAQGVAQAGGDQDGRGAGEESMESEDTFISVRIIV